MDLAAVMASVRATQAVIEPHDSPDRLRDLGIEVITGSARFTSPTTVDVDGRSLRFRRAAIATGSGPVLPPVPGLDAVGALTSDTVWGLTDLPSRLVVLGGGPIGCELGQSFARLGSHVTIVEMADHLLPREQPEAGAVIARRLAAEGVDVRLGTTAVGAATRRLTVRTGGVDDELAFDQVLVATGRAPRTADLGLDVAGVALTRTGHVAVDDRLRTSNRRIYAGGDVTGRLPFTHAAANHGVAIATNALFGLPRKVDESRIPWVTFTDPEVAHVGLTPAQAHERWGEAAIVRTQDLAEVDRAVTARATDGFVTLVADPKQRIVGATIVAPAAGESIAEIVAWMANTGRISDVGMTIHAYPTWSEGQSRAGVQVVQETWNAPRVTRLTRALLAILRVVDRG